MYENIYNAPLLQPKQSRVRTPIAGNGFSSVLKMHYRQGKGEGDGSAQRGRSMLSTIALFPILVASE